MMGGRINKSVTDTKEAAGGGTGSYEKRSGVDGQWRDGWC